MANVPTALYDGDFIDLTSENEPPRSPENDVVLVLDSSRPVETLSVRIQDELNKNKNIVIKANSETSGTVITKKKDVNSKEAPKEIRQEPTTTVKLVKKTDSVLKPGEKRLNNLEVYDIILTPSSSEIRNKKFPIEPPTETIDNDNDDVIVMPAQSAPPAAKAVTQAVLQEIAPPIAHKGVLIPVKLATKNSKKSPILGTKVTNKVSTTKARSQLPQKLPTNITQITSAVQLNVTQKETQNGAKGVAKAGTPQAKSPLTQNVGKKFLLIPQQVMTKQVKSQNVVKSPLTGPFKIQHITLEGKKVPPVTPKTQVITVTKKTQPLTTQAEAKAFERSAQLPNESHIIIENVYSLSEEKDAVTVTEKTCDGMIIDLSDDSDGPQEITQPIASSNPLGEKIPPKSKVNLKPITPVATTLADAMETASAVATITGKETAKIPNVPAKYPVYLILCPVDSDSGKPIQTFKEGQVNQILALIPNGSESHEFPTFQPPSLTAPKEKVKKPQPVLKIPNNPPPREDIEIEPFEPPPLTYLKGKVKKPQRVLKISNNPPPKEDTEIEPVQPPSLTSLKGKVEKPQPVFKLPNNPPSKEDIEIEPLCSVTPVDITEIINKGKPVELMSRCRLFQGKLKSHFKGFTKRELRKSSCIREVAAILKSEEFKFQRLKKSARALYETNFVVCNSSDDFLPETVKIEIEDESEEIAESNETFPGINEIISQVNKEVTEIKRNKVGTKGKLSKPNEGLELIKKGLELIQNWSQQSGKPKRVEKVQRNVPPGSQEVRKLITKAPVEESAKEVTRGRVRKVKIFPDSITEEVQVRKRQKKADISGEPSKLKAAGISAVNMNRGLVMTMDEPKSKRIKTSKMDGNEDDDLLVVKKVDIIKYNVQSKRGRRK